MTAMTYRVTGMTCEHCVRAVSIEIQDLDGVNTVTVELVPGGESAVTVMSDVPLTAQQLKTALYEAGDYHLA
jgi:copper chaperone